VVEAPVADGQVVYPDILGTGVDIVSSRKLERETA
jgi:CxxC motif-containing protein